MGNILKKFALNKTTVTIIGVALSAIVLIVGYNYRTNNAISTKTVYYVTEDVKSNMQLNESVIKKVKLSSNAVKVLGNVVTDLKQIKDDSGEFFYVNYGHTIKAGSLIYLGDLISKENKADEKLYHNLKENQTIFKINVDLDTTQGNSIRKGDAIDIYVDGKDEDGKAIYTPFITNLKVIDVVDNKWSTTSGDESSAPKYLVTAVDENMFKLLSKITLIPKYSFRLIPQTTGEKYVENSEAEIVNDKLVNIIEAYTSYNSQ